MTNETQQPLWRTVGYKFEAIDAAAREISRGTEWLKEAPSGPGELGVDWIWRLEHFGREAFLLGWMGHPAPHPDLIDWRGVGRKIVEACEHYFFGDWRRNFLYYGEPYDWSKSRMKSVPWFDAYRVGLALALCLGDLAAADRLLGWSGRDLWFDEGTWDKTRSDVAYQIWLASRLRGEPVESTDDLLACALENRNVGTKRLVDASQALIAGRSADFRLYLRLYLQSYRLRELDHRVVTAMSLEATVLWHLARRRGMELVSLPEELTVLIPRA